MKKIVDKTAEEQFTTPERKVIRDTSVSPLTITNSTPADLVRSGAGVVPIGYYKGGVAFWDLDKAVNQPLVWAEQQYILGNIDGAGATGLCTITMPAAAVAGTVVSGNTITVPAGQVWYVNAVVGTCLADATGTVVYNWRCSLFADALANALGGVYHTAWLATPLGPQNDEFCAQTMVFAIGNKPVMLRMPAGTTITGQLMNAAGALATTGVVGTMQVFGYIGKVLVA